jgi:small-conductance mechanosensitive channel
MAIPWLAILSNVPWKDVINNAPKVADGAKKLWKSVAKKSGPSEPANTNVQPAHSSEEQTIASLDTRIIELKNEVAALHDQMLASSEIIEALAEQNTQLIKSIAIFRGRVLRLGLLTVTLSLVALLALYRTFP